MGYLRCLNTKHQKTRNVSPTTVTVFTDSQTAITKILDPKTRPRGDTVGDLFYQNTYEIRNGGHTLVLRWVLSHSKITDNEKADAVVKEVAYKGGRETDLWSSLTHIKAEPQKTRSAELLICHQSKKEEGEATAQEFYVPQARSGISPILGKVLKKYAI